MLALGYVSMAASLSTDLYLPSYPDLAQYFGVGASVVQFTLTGFLIGAATGQLFVGALSDALGRRRTLLIALAVFTVCSFVAVFSVSIEMLIAVRCLQGFAGAAGSVLARAVVADLASPAETAKAFGALFVMTSLGPAIANPLGAWLTELGGWRAPLLSLSILAAGMFVVAAMKIPESLPPEKRQPFHPGKLAQNLWRLTLSPSFMGFALAFGLGYAGMVVYISSSSFIGQDVYGLSPFGYSLTFALGSVSFMTGAWMSSRLVARRGSADTLRLGQLLQIIAAVGGLILAAVGLLPLVPYLLVIVFFCGGTGVVLSTSSALAIAQAVGIAGAGSALVGFCQYFLGALGTPLGGLAGSGTVIPALASMVVLSVLSFIAAGVARRRPSAAGPLQSRQ